MQHPIITHHAHQVLIASADISSPSTNKATTHKQQRQQQRHTVRQLLSYCLSYYPDYLEFQSDTHPYYLFNHTHNKKFFVSFSHSRHQVALIIAPTPCGIDIEHSPISQEIVHRFFHSNEIALLDSLPTNTQAFARLKLWQLKESFTKASVTTLSQTLSQDFSQIVATLFTTTLLNHHYLCHSHDNPSHVIKAPNNPYAITYLYDTNYHLALTLG